MRATSKSSDPRRRNRSTADSEPDPARSYERAKPEKEAGMGRLDNDAAKATPANQPDTQRQTVSNARAPRPNPVADAPRAGAAPNNSTPGLENPVLNNPSVNNPLLDEDPTQRRPGKRRGRG